MRTQVWSACEHRVPFLSVVIVCHKKATMLHLESPHKEVLSDRRTAVPRQGRGDLKHKHERFPGSLLIGHWFHLPGWDTLNCSLSGRKETHKKGTQLCMHYPAGADLARRSQAIKKELFRKTKYRKRRRESCLFS